MDTALPPDNKPRPTPISPTEESVGSSTLQDEAAFSADRILQAAMEGDREAFAAIVKEHQLAVFAYLRSRLLAAADAEDLCQEVFLRSYRGREQFARAVELRAWLIGIARNVLREHVRKSSRRRETAWTELCLELDELAAAQDAQRDARHSSEAMEYLPGCLDSLGQTSRQAIDMYYADQLRLAEIGKRTDRTEGAVKLLMYRARQALKNCLNRKMHN